MKYAWIFLFVTVLFAIFIDDLSYIFGFTVNVPLGISLLVLDLIGASVILKPFRKGKKWAWYFLWYFLIKYAAFFLANPSIFSRNLIADPVSDLVSVGFGVILPLLGLLLSYRKFFPKKQLVAP